MDLIYGNPMAVSSFSLGPSQLACVKLPGRPPGPDSSPWLPTIILPGTYISRLVPGTWDSDPGLCKCPSPYTSYHEYTHMLEAEGEGAATAVTRKPRSVQSWDSHKYLTCCSALGNSKTLGASKGFPISLLLLTP